MNIKSIISLLFILALISAFQNCSPLESNPNFQLSPSSGAALGKTIYESKCSMCHNAIETSAKTGKPPTQISWAIKNVPEMRGIDLSDFEVKAVAEALKIDDSICEVQDLPGHTPSSRLSHTEYERSVNHLFGTNSSWTSSYSSDNSAGLFDNEVFSKSTNPQLVEAYFETSRDIVNTVFSNSSLRARLVSCNPNQGINCASQTLNKIGRIAFKRPLANEDMNVLLAPYQKARSLGMSFDDSLKASLRAILISPEFLFKTYKENSSLVRNLDSYELATRLSYFIWGSLPDETLLSKAESNALMQSSVLDQEIQRLLNDPKADYLIESFGLKWVGLEDIDESSKQPDTNLYPNFTPQLKQDMIKETTQFISRFIKEDKSPLDLVLGNYTYLNQRLSDHYGLSMNVGNDFKKVTLPSLRTGVLTHGAVLTMTSNPNETSVVNRGSWALKRLLCQEPPPDAPPGVSTEVPDIEGLSLRERLKVHRDKPACISCHAVMDPLGFAFENFDAVGVYRSKWSDGFTVDATGSLPDGSDFEGVHELALKITENQEFQKCFTEHFMSFALGRQIGPKDRCTVNRIGKRSISSTSKFSDLVKSVVKSDPFKRYQNEEVE